MIDFESALIFFDCARCGGTGMVQLARGRDLCEGCDGAQQHTVYLGTLFANFAIAGALCAAFKLGRAHGVDEAATQVGMWPSTNPWQPNTDGREVPGRGRR